MELNTALEIEPESVIEVSVFTGADETVTVLVAVTVPLSVEVAVIVAEPATTPVTTPPLTVATLSLLLDQVTLLLALEGVGVTISDCVPLTVIVELDGESVRAVGAVVV